MCCPTLEVLLCSCRLPKQELSCALRVLKKDDSDSFKQDELIYKHMSFMAKRYAGIEVSPDEVICQPI